MSNNSEFYGTRAKYCILIMAGFFFLSIAMNIWFYIEFDISIKNTDILINSLAQRIPLPESYIDSNDLSIRFDRMFFVVTVYTYTAIVMNVICVLYYMFLMRKLVILVGRSVVYWSIVIVLSVIFMSLVGKLYLNEIYFMPSSYLNALLLIPVGPIIAYFRIKELLLTQKELLLT